MDLHSILNALKGKLDYLEWKAKKESCEPKEVNKDYELFAACYKTLNTMIGAINHESRERSLRAD